MTQYARPESDISNAGSWSPSTGSDLFAVIDEASTDDSDYVTVDGGTMAAVKMFEVALGSITDPASSDDHKFVVRASDAAGVGVVDMTFVLKQGSTIIANSSQTSTTSSAANYTTILSAGEADNITDYSDLRIHVSGVDNMGMSTTMTIFQAYFEAPDAATPPSSGRNRVGYSPAYSPAASPGFDPTKKSM